MRKGDAAFGVVILNRFHEADNGPEEWRAARDHPSNGFRSWRLHETPRDHG
jgi:hypothetical protein